MKILILLFLLGVASASYQDELDNSDDQLFKFLERASSLNYENAYLSEDADEDTKVDLGEHLRDALDKLLEKVKDAIEEGKVIEQKFMDKIREIRDKMQKMKVEMGEKGRELLDKIREKARDYLRNLLQKVTREKQFAASRSDVNWQDMLRKVKEHLKKTVDPDLLKEKIEKIFGQGSELLDQLLQTLREKGRRKMEMLIDLLLDEDEDESDRLGRGFGDYWEKVKNFFKDLHIDLKEKYSKFGEWVKEKMDKGMEKSKDKMDNIRAIAFEFLKNAKGISKEIASEAGEFFKAYKEELGNVWDEIKERVNEIKNRKD